MSESNTIIGINFGTAYTSIAYLNKVKRLEIDPCRVIREIDVPLFKSL
jgi:molecular chaperone DnaK (HSP70)